MLNTVKVLLCPFAKDEEKNVRAFTTLEINTIVIMHQPHARKEEVRRLRVIDECHLLPELSQILIFYQIGKLVKRML